MTHAVHLCCTLVTVFPTSWKNSRKLVFSLKNKRETKRKGERGCLDNWERKRDGELLNGVCQTASTCQKDYSTFLFLPSYQCQQSVIWAITHTWLPVHQDLSNYTCGSTKPMMFDSLAVRGLKALHQVRSFVSSPPPPPPTHTPTRTHARTHTHTHFSLCHRDCFSYLFLNFSH